MKIVRNYALSKFIFQRSFHLLSFVTIERVGKSNEWKEIFQETKSLWYWSDQIENATRAEQPSFGHRIAKTGYQTQGQRYPLRLGRAFKWIYGFRVPDCSANFHCSHRRSWNLQQFNETDIASKIQYYSNKFCIRNAFLYVAIDEWCLCLWCKYSVI